MERAGERETDEGEGEKKNQIRLQERMKFNATT